METPTDQPTETLTGLGATGVDLALAHIIGAPLQSHVMVPSDSGLYRCHNASQLRARTSIW